jgi:hypothetical protein
MLCFTKKLTALVELALCFDIVITVGGFVKRMGKGTGKKNN